ncbi:putative oxidoreductase YjmC [Calliopsis andreniformis]|uniref:putative oxidoreductase YjmC n=1 Tax=Calliopsis andreniformis TaxID=337506 RepID=UPI003FCE2275
MSKLRRSILTATQAASKLLLEPAKLNLVAVRSMAACQMSKEETVVPKDEVVRFVGECLCKVGASAEDGKVVGHHLMTADYCGHFSHGMNRLQMYVKDIQSKVTDPAAAPKVLTDFQAIALVSGCNAMGHVIGKFCMELAIEKAKKFGIGMVAARDSTHYGICGYYTSMAMDQGLIGFSCTNTSPMMVPTRSKAPALGTNPLSLGMSACDGDHFLLDMATTAVAVGKIELAIRKNEPIPAGWALGSDGKVTTDAEDAYKDSLLMPLGGEEHTSGYKGYGLGLMVEVLCGILSGSEFGPSIRKWKDKSRIANLGQCFMAINPEAFGPGSKERLSHLLKQLRCLPKAGDKPVLVPGDPEMMAKERVDTQGGIIYHPNQIKACEELAKELGVEPMKLCPKKGGNTMVATN